MFFKPFKVNITDCNGKRTSTTISYQIAEFYCRICHEKEYFDFIKDNTSVDDRVFFIRNLVQKQINDYNDKGVANSKSSIELALLSEAEYRLVKRN